MYKLLPLPFDVKELRRLLKSNIGSLVLEFEDTDEHPSIETVELREEPEDLKSLRL